jgi:hypothetical protein
MDLEKSGTKPIFSIYKSLRLTSEFSFNKYKFRHF